MSLITTCPICDGKDVNCPACFGSDRVVIESMETYYSKEHRYAVMFNILDKINNYMRSGTPVNDIPGLSSTINKVLRNDKATIDALIKGKWLWSRK